MMKQNWIYKKLGEVCESDLGKTLNQSKDKGDFYPYLCSINIQWDKIDMSILKQTRFENGELERYSVVKGDLLVCEGGDVGRAAIWNEDYPIQYQNALHRVRFNGEILNRFCLYHLFYLKQTGAIDTKYSKGVTIKHLVKSSLLSIPIPLPPLNLQQSIVAELDNINNLINIKKAQLNDLDNLAQSIFYEMFGDLNVQKNTLIELCNSKNDIKCGPFGTQLSKTEYTKKGVAVWGIPQINSHFKIQPSDYVTEEKADYLKDYDVIAGDIVMSRKGNVGQCCVYPKSFPLGIIHSDVLRIRLDSNKTNSLFMMYQLHLSENVKHQIQLVSSGAIMPGINVTKLKKIEVDVPPLPLQQKFAEKIEAIEKHKQVVNVTIKDHETLLASRMQFWFE